MKNRDLTSEMYVGVHHINSSFGPKGELLREKDFDEFGINVISGNSLDRIRSFDFPEFNDARSSILMILESHLNTHGVYSRVLISFLF